MAWTPSRALELSNLYIKENVDIILINSHGCSAENRINIFGYNIYQRNREQELNNGVTIVIKKNIKHKLDDSYNSNTLSVEIETNSGPLILPIPDFRRFARLNKSVFNGGF